MASSPGGFQSLKEMESVDPKQAYFEGNLNWCTEINM